MLAEGVQDPDDKHPSNTGKIVDSYVRHVR